MGAAFRRIQPVLKSRPVYPPAALAVGVGYLVLNSKASHQTVVTNRGFTEARAGLTDGKRNFLTGLRLDSRQLMCVEN